jgi:hypothetical protein
MDHAYIADNSLVERYHQGLLPPDEEARFEEHFFACPLCMEELELARGFQRGIKAMAAEDAARAAAVAAATAAVQLGLFAWLARRGRLAQWGVVLIVVLVGLLPALWFSARSRDERQTAERNAVDLQRRLTESEQRRSQERRELESKLAQAKPPEAPLPSPTNVAVVLLTAVRGEAGEPAATIDLARSGGLVALAVDAGADPLFESYRATLTKAGATVFRQAGLQPNALEVVMVAFPSSFFSPGDYRLRIEGVKPGGAATEIGGYPCRVVGKR